jgi:hypothetical protein
MDAGSAILFDSYVVHHISFCVDQTSFHVDRSIPVRLPLQGTKYVIK